MPANADSRSDVPETPPLVERVLADFIEAAKESFRDDLVGVVLFGSGAEGRLRATSDVNLLVILRQFRQDRADTFREPLRLAHVTARVVAMFVLESELAAAAEAFAVKFGDIARRCRVLHGDFPIGLLAVSPEAKRQQLRQLLMNLTLRLRHSYVVASLREEQLATVIAKTAGPLRSAAAAFLELEGRPVGSPKQALEAIAGTLDGDDWTEALHGISEARESRRLPAGTAASVMFRIMALTEAMRLQTEKLSLT